jgi:hypothetical protein
MCLAVGKLSEDEDVVITGSKDHYIKVKFLVCHILVVTCSTQHFLSCQRLSELHVTTGNVSMCLYNYHNSEHYPSSCLLFKTQLNSIDLSVPHRKHITPPLQAQQVNAIYRFVTMLYYNYHNSGH